MYVSRDVPAAKSNWTQGKVHGQETSFVGNCAKITPAPWTLRTAFEATAGDLCDRDWKQRTTFPLAKVAFRVSKSQLLQKYTISEYSFLPRILDHKDSCEQEPKYESYPALFSSTSVAAISSPYTIGWNLFTSLPV